MKRIIIILIIIVGIVTTTFTIFEPFNLDTSVKTAEALGQQSSTSSHNNSFISAIPLAVDVSEMSVNTDSLLSPPPITLIVVALGLITTAAIVWDRQPIPINQS